MTRPAPKGLYHIPPAGRKSKGGNFLGINNQTPRRRGAALQTEADGLGPLRGHLLAGWDRPGWLRDLEVFRDDGMRKIGQPPRIALSRG